MMDDDSPVVELTLRAVEPATEGGCPPIALELNGVMPVRSIEELRGAPLGDMDDFLAALHMARGGVG
jgi:hypothetical protein